jgi:hypothetical protein
VQLFVIVIVITMGVIAAIGALGYLLDKSIDGLERHKVLTRRAPTTESDETFAPGELPHEHSGTIG